MNTIFSLRPLWPALAALGLLVFGGSGAALAQGGFTGPSADMRASGSGFTGPGPSLTSAEQAKTLNDDAQIVLEGNIVQRISDDMYVFQDDSGTIEVDIDRKRWQGLSVSPADVVRLWGKVDKDWNSVEVDVKRIEMR